MLNAITLIGQMVPLRLAAAKPSGDKAADGVFPPFDPAYFATQIFWLFLTFGVLYFLLSKILSLIHISEPTRPY